MQSVKNLVNEFRELRDAAASHNPQPDLPEETQPGISSKPEHITTSDATDPEHAHIPPPPPRDLPHGWTARYDEKEKKYAYSHGITAQEQWDFPLNTKEPPQLPPMSTHGDSFLETKAEGKEAKRPLVIEVKAGEVERPTPTGLASEEEMIPEGLV